MAINGDANDYVSSSGLNSGDAKQTADAPSAEDVAWADSCLAVNSVSQSGWESLRDALLDALDSQSDSLKHEKHDFHSGNDTETMKWSKLTENAVSFSDGATEMIKLSKLAENAVNSSNGGDTDMIGSSKGTENIVDSSDGADTEMISSSKPTESVNVSHGADTEMVSSNNDTKTSVNWDEAADNDTSLISDGKSGTENGDSLGAGFNLDNVFLPTYNESNRNIGFSGLEYEPAFPAFVINDQSPEDIFKVWELESPGDDEEFINEFDEEFVKELNKALSENPLEPLPTASDVSGPSNDLSEVDDLISGIGDLSLVEGV